MDLYLTADDHRRGLARAIYEQIREAIAEGRVRPGDRLPPSRDLARQLGVSRFTVTTAYGFLAAEGFIQGATGGGTRICAVRPPSSIARARTAEAPLAARVPRLPPAAPDSPPASGEPMLHVRLGVPDAALFPFTDWRRHTFRAMRTLRGARPAYGDAAGDPKLRTAIADWIHRSRGVRTHADRIVVTAGAQQAFDLILGALVQPGDPVAVEDPGYPPFRKLAQFRGAKVVPVPVDDEGLVTSALPARAKLVYITPSHQFPRGSALSLARRRELLDWARRAGAHIVEDDYDSEYRFMDRPLEPLQRLDADERVIYVGSFSKTLSPALRAGFVSAPPKLASAIAGLRQLVDWHSPEPLQLTLAGFLSDGSMDRHLRRARRIYRARHQAIADWCEGPGRSIGHLIRASAGLHVAIALHPTLDEFDLIERAAKAGLAVQGLSKFSIEATQRGLTLGYGSVSMPELERALGILAALARRRASR
ncbi:PLP-dependent aminotransferase family protein [Pendulispora albinea]|uniref:PLP-dependent aminotransferase family protein n=1 Tax=Pendulispora albinea TaxID=2741071 RepID=A0ABZ2M0W3_9BACT